MIDTGALGVSGNYISSTLLTSLRIPIKPHLFSKSTEAINGSQVTILGTTGPLSCNFNGNIHILDFNVIDMPHFDAILGLHWFRTFQPTIDFHTLQAILPTSSSSQENLSLPNSTNIPFPLPPKHSPLSLDASSHLYCKLPANDLTYVDLIALLDNPIDILTDEPLNLLASCENTCNSS